MIKNIKANNDSFFKPIILVTVVGLAFSGPLGRLALEEGMTPVGIAFWRLFMAATLTFIASMFVKPSRRAYIKITKHDILFTALAGMSLAVHFFFWYTSLNFTTIFHATVLACLQPLFAIVMGYIIWREKVNKFGIFGIILAVIGTITMAIMTINDPGATIKGDVFAVLMGIFLTFYLIFGRGVRQHMPVLTYTTLLYGFCTLALLLLALIFRIHILPVTGKMLIICLLIVVFTTFMGHTIFNWALPHVGPVYITVIMLSEPVGASIVAWFMFNEVPSILSLTGGALILFGMGLYTFKIAKT